MDKLTDALLKGMGSNRPQPTMTKSAAALSEKARVMSEAFLQHAPMVDNSELSTRYGYPVVDANSTGYVDYFKKNPHVAGMAVGKGLNGDDSPVRSIVVNPFNDAMLDEGKREALYKVEAARHIMAEKPAPKFAITPGMQKWREQKFVKGRDPYATDNDAFRESVISRMLVGDDAPEDIPDEVRKYTSELDMELERRSRLKR